MLFLVATFTLTCHPCSCTYAEILQNFRPNDKMPLSGRGRCQAQRAYGQRHTHRNGSVTTPIEVVLPGEVSHELSEEEFPILGNGKSSFQHQSSVWVSSKSNDLFHPVETYDFQLSEVPLPEVTTQLASLWSDSAESPSPVSESNQERYIFFSPFLLYVSS